jgi:hypothetical protein
MAPGRCSSAYASGTAFSGHRYERQFNVGFAFFHLFFPLLAACGKNGVFSDQGGRFTPSGRQSAAATTGQRFVPLLETPAVFHCFLSHSLIFYVLYLTILGP